MQTVKVELENCYGIGRLVCEFDFAQAKVHSIYAPNGFMKTSFARTFRDISRSEPSVDQMFPARITRREVSDEGGNAIRAEQVLVIPPYEEAYQPEHVSTLLVEESLKARYDAATADVEKRKADLLSALKTRSGLTGRKITPESELQLVFEVDSLFDAIEQMTGAAATADASLETIPYSLLFSAKPLEFLTSQDVLAQIETYVRQFEDLVSKSPILTNQFTHTQASTLQKTLQESRFFDAQHWLVLNDGGTPVEIRAADALRQRVDEELKRVLADEGLRNTFDAFDKKISGNQELRELREYLHEHQDLLSRLTDMHGLRKAVWGAYLGTESALLSALREQYALSREVIQQVVTQAQSQATEWSKVVETFNQRFCVPFTLRVQNQADVILKEVKEPRVEFQFNDNGDTANVNSSNELLLALSQGERRALYLLNVIFELRAREKAGAPVLLIVDDIADSFDYRNKYAIIEYLQDVSKSGVFRLIVLTHNFDFHRSAAGRLNVPRDNRRLAVRAGRDVSLVKEKYQGNPLKHWQSQPGDAEKFLASVPFVRNLAEYCGHEDVFDTLTEVLHMKGRTKTMTLADLDVEYAKVVKNYTVPATPPRTKKVADLLESTATAIAANPVEHVELEAKVVLSMAIRLKAEEHMIARLANPNFVASITKDQTQKLLQEYRLRFPGADRELAVLGQVQLMTPENIHLNSFMFEPIIDLGIVHLKQLFNSVCAL